MRVRTVSLLSVAGMLLTSATVYSLTPAPAGNAGVTAIPDAVPGGGVVEQPPVASFEAGTTLRVSGRVGHPTMIRGSSGETFVLLEVGAGEGSAAPVGAGHLAIVIDRSGSMAAGNRLKNAIAGAIEAVDRLGNDQRVSVVAFDSVARTVVPMTVLGPVTRDQVKAEIRKIAPAGDTCISCGIEEGLRELARSPDKIDRMILLSDGDATTGVRDPDGFRAIAERARVAGTSISTVGVGVEYNQKIMGGIALQGGGEHYFIENAASLQRVFQAEADKLRATVARDAEASIDLGEGVEVDRVLDRTFERRGRRVVVPLGNFGRGEQKTVLVQVRVPTRSPGHVPVANVSLDYRDLVRGERGSCAGSLEVAVGADTAGIDALVDGRVQRSKTAAALLEANELVEHGKVEEARRTLANRQQEIAAAAATATAAAAVPPPRRADVDSDFAGQASAVSTAAAALAAPRPAATSRAVRANQEKANAFFR